MKLPIRTMASRAQRRAALLAGIALAALGAAAPAPAIADTALSSNWAGYAAHRSGVRFNRVLASWRQPRATCVAGSQTYSAMWVGIGGFSTSAQALEQIGTEVDCTASGAVSSGAWYELVPAPSNSIPMTIRPGDAMFAEVAVSGHNVTLSITDTTRHRSYKRTFHPARVDVSSAEWIVEAPSGCASSGACQALPLTDFGSTSFAFASARSGTGHVGAISDRAWGTTKITLLPTGSGPSAFVVYRGAGAGTATPSSLTRSGTAFSVAFGTVPLSVNRFMGRRAGGQPVRIVHPLR